MFDITGDNKTAPSMMARSCDNAILGKLPVDEKGTHTAPEILTGPEAREIIGVTDERELLTLPNLSGTLYDKWKYVFIQSSSRIKTLLRGTHFMFYERQNDKAEKHGTSSMTFTDDLKLAIIDEEYYKLKKVPEECVLLEFANTIEGVTYNPVLGYGFYEFTKPEYIFNDQQVILMGKDDKLYYGPNAHYAIIGIGTAQTYIETNEIEPTFDKEKWKRIFIQAERRDSDVRKLRPDTWFLYCNIASTEEIKVLEPFEIFEVNHSEKDEDERKLIKFAKKNIPNYNPAAGYAYFQFTRHQYVRPLAMSIMALKKNGELFTGRGILRLIPAVADGRDKEIDPPNLSDTEWDCIFLQGRRGYGRLLGPYTRFLYCEYDYKPEI